MTSGRRVSVFDQFRRLKEPPFPKFSHNTARSIYSDFATLPRITLSHKDLVNSVQSNAPPRPTRREFREDTVRRILQTDRNRRIANRLMEYRAHEISNPMKLPIYSQATKSRQIHTHFDVPCGSIHHERDSPQNYNDSVSMGNDFREFSKSFGSLYRRYVFNEPKPRLPEQINDHTKQQSHKTSDQRLSHQNTFLTELTSNTQTDNQTQDEDILLLHNMKRSKTNRQLKQFIEGRHREKSFLTDDSAEDLSKNILKGKKTSLSDNVTPSDEMTGLERTLTWLSTADSTDNAP